MIKVSKILLAVMRQDPWGFILPDGKIYDGEDYDLWGGHFALANMLLGRKESDANAITDGSYAELYAMGWLRYYLSDDATFRMSTSPKNLTTANLHRLQKYIQDSLSAEYVHIDAGSTQLSLSAEDFLTANKWSDLKRLSTFYAA